VLLAVGVGEVGTGVFEDHGGFLVWDGLIIQGLVGRRGD